MQKWRRRKSDGKFLQSKHSVFFFFLFSLCHSTEDFACHFLLRLSPLLLLPNWRDDAIQMPHMCCVMSWLTDWFPVRVQSRNRGIATATWWKRQHYYINDSNQLNAHQQKRFSIFSSVYWSGHWHHSSLTQTHNHQAVCVEFSVAIFTTIVTYFYCFSLELDRDSVLCFILSSILDSR